MQTTTSAQLGHGGVEVTSKHYARWCGGAEYRRRIVPEPHELPADLLARLSGAGRDVRTRDARSLDHYSKPRATPEAIVRALRSSR